MYLLLLDMIATRLNNLLIHLCHRIVKLRKTMLLNSKAEKTLKLKDIGMGELN